MKKIRIEIHMTEAETRLIDDISQLDGRSRKNWCEEVIKEAIRKSISNQDYLRKSLDKAWDEHINEQNLDT